MSSTAWFGRRRLRWCRGQITTRPAESATQIKHIRAQADDLERESSERAREYAHWLVSHAVPVRDIAALLEISPQRVSQLANS
jgi:hypothetical protein